MTSSPLSPVTASVTPPSTSNTAAVTHERSLICEICDYPASSNTVLKSHISRKHKQKTYSPNTELVTTPVLPPIEYQMSVKSKCELCSDTFVDKVYFEENIIKNHSSHENNVSTLFLKPSKHKFTCSHCGYGCNTSKAQKVHHKSTLHQFHNFPQA